MMKNHNSTTQVGGAKWYSRRRSQLLSTASGLAVVGLLGLGGTAMAAYVSVDPAGDLIANGYVTVIGSQNNTSTEVNPTSINSILSNITGGLTITGTPGNPTPNTGSVTANTIGAYATGNSAKAAVDLAAIGPGPSGGIGVLTSSANVPYVGDPGNATTINASVTSSSLNNTQTNVVTGSALTQTNNLVTAQTTGNVANSTVSGVVPSSYSGGGIPASAYLSGAGLVSAGANIAVATNQINDSVGQSTGSGALVGGDSVSQTINSDAGATPQLLALSATQTGNAVSASFTGNSATNGVTANTGGAPTLAGSIAISNQQVNATTLPASGDVLAAANEGSTVSSVVASGGPANNPITLQNGVVTQTGNTLSASATGNSAVGASTGTAGNVIQLADGLSQTGSMPVSSSFITASSFGGGAVSVSGDLALANGQGNVTTPLSSEVAGGTVSTVVQNAVGGTVNVGSNAVTASTVGNNASNAILAPGTSGTTTASLSGTMAVASAQGNVDSALISTVTGNQVAAVVGTDGTNAASPTATVTGSSVTVADTSIKAATYGNEASNTLSVAANTVGSGVAGSASLITTANPSAAAGLSLNNFQGSVGSPASAVNTGNSITLTANSAAPGVGSLGDTLGITGRSGAPTIDAIAISNTASNAVSATATTLSDSAGLLNTQTDSSGASALVGGSTIVLSANTTSAAPVTGSALTVGTSLDGTAGTGNTLRAISYSNQASNTLSATATTLNNPGASPAIASSVLAAAPATSETVAAGYGLLNSQSADGGSSAISGYGSTPLAIAIGAGGVSNSQVSNTGNGVVSAAYGNQATNSGTIAANTVPQLVGAYSPLANVTSGQNLTGAGVTADLTGPVSGGLFGTSVGAGGATAATLGVSDNTGLTQAIGNQASNSLAASGNSIADASAGPLTGLSYNTTLNPGIAVADLAFSTQNVQNSSVGINAAQTNGGALLAIGGDVLGSTAQAQGNQFLATAYNNTASNGVTLGTADAPITTLAASGGVQNVQSASGVTSATLGQAGMAATPGQPADNYSGSPLTFTINTGGGSITYDGTSLVVPAGSSLSFDVTALDANQLAAVEAVLGNNVSGGILTVGPNTYLGLQALGFTATIGGGGVVSAASFTTVNVPATGGTPGTPANPSVQVTIAGNITNSTVGVNGNTANATAVANNASNVATVNATTLTPSAGVLGGTAGASVGTAGVTAVADYAASNNQSATAATTANAFGQFSLSASADAPVISASTLSVSNNTQQAAAEANLATTSLTVAAGNSNGTSAALVNNQVATGGVTATSGSPSGTPTLGQIVQAPGAISGGSSLAMSGNSNSALGVGNDATNTLSASATNLTTASVGPTNASATLVGLTASAVADYALTSVQSTSGPAVSAAANTTVLNNDSLATTTSGLSDSAVAINNNSTSANAFANRASNTLNLSGTNVSATGAVASSQTNASATTATALATVGFSLNGGTLTPAATGSSIAVGGNTVQAQAVGNQATNALNATPAAAYGVQSPADAFGASNTPAATASYAVLNAQTNTGAISATGASGSQFSVALNGSGGGTTPVNASTVSVQGNSLAVSGYGNSATNSLSLVALNTGNPTAALSNVQSNSGDVTALATNTAFGVAVGGPGAIGSTFTVGGNSITARAVGNAVSNTVSVVH